MKPAEGYIRVSTGRQADEGLSLDDQREKLSRWAYDNGYMLCIYEDHRSGREADRRKVREAVQEACDLKAPFLAWKVDRFARNAEDALGLARTLKEAGAQLVIVGESFDSTTPAGRMMFGIMAVLAEWFSDQLSETMKASHAYRKAEGLKTSRYRRYGARDEKEMQAVHYMRLLREDHWSYGRIAAWLEANDYRTRTGKSVWSKRLIKTLIERSYDERSHPSPAPR